MRNATSVVEKPHGVDKTTQRKSRISLVLSKSMRQTIERTAKRERRSINAQCVVLLERGLLPEGAPTG